MKENDYILKRKRTSNYNYMKEKEWTYIINFPSGELAPNEEGIMIPFDVRDMKNLKSFDNREDAAEEASAIAGKYSWRLFPLVFEMAIS